MENINVGKQIEKARKTKGWSSSELAKLAQITPSMLSQIERGLANPSIHTLKVLAKTLNVPTFSFFLEETITEDLIVKSGNRKKMIIDHLSYELLSPDFTGNLATAIMKVPANVSSSEQPLGHRGEEVAFILEGRITLFLGEEQYVLETGDSVKIPANMKHKWVNPFEQTAAVLFSVTPPAF